MPYATLTCSAMRRWVWLSALLLALLAALATRAVHAQTPDPVAQTDPPANLFNTGSLPIPPFEPGAVLMGMREDVVSAATLLDELQVTAVEDLDLRGLDGGQGTGGVTGLHLYVPPGQEWAVIEQLQQHPAVVFAEPNWVVQIAEAPIAVERTTAQAAAPETPLSISDTLYAEQWYLQRINMSRGWLVAQLASQGEADPMRVAIIDTGVDYDHPDLQGRLLPGRNYITPLPGETPAMDDNGHGTHIAGLIGALVNNGDGIAGAALAVQLEPIKVLDASGRGFVSTVAQAIRDTAGTGADILNLSLEIARTVDSSQLNTLRSAVNYANDRGALLIAAAGNCVAIGCPVFYPAALDNVLAVGATSYADTPVYYSPIGPEIDLVAPGGGAGISILSTWAQVAANKCTVGLREVDGGIYCPKDGTSMAAALTTGVAALVWRIDPDLTAQQVRERLVNSAAPLDAPPAQVGAGRLDAAAAARYALPAQLYVSQNHFTLAFARGSAPQHVPLTLENDSLDPITWTLATRRNLTWLESENPGGTVRYGEPVQAQLVITPAQLSPGLHMASLLLTGTHSDGLQVEQTVLVDVTIYTETTLRGYLPLVAVTDAARPTWLEPGSEGRTIHELSGSDDLPLALPFAFDLHGQTITETRLFADGFITFPATVGMSNLPNRCFANWVLPEAGVYGWWADLDPGAAGGQVSTFQPDADRFVVEYANVPSAAGISPSYEVSFQIVLHRSGRIDLHYWQMPDELHTQPQVTVGVRTQGGRFYNQIACRAGSTVLGSLPRTNESFTLEAKDLY